MQECKGFCCFAIVSAARDDFLASCQHFVFSVKEEKETN